MKWVEVESTPSMVDSFSDTKPATFWSDAPFAKTRRSYPPDIR
jgi:hypothetical protein